MKNKSKRTILFNLFCKKLNNIELFIQNAVYRLVAQYKRFNSKIIHFSANPNLK